MTCCFTCAQLVVLGSESCREQSRISSSLPSIARMAPSSQRRRAQACLSPLLHFAVSGLAWFSANGAVVALGLASRATFSDASSGWVPLGHEPWVYVTCPA